MSRRPHNCGRLRRLALLAGGAFLAPFASALILGGSVAVQTSPPADATISATALGNGAERLDIRDLATTASAPRRFLRVRVTQ